MMGPGNRAPTDKTVHGLDLDEPVITKEEWQARLQDVKLRNNYPQNFGKQVRPPATLPRNHAQLKWAEEAEEEEDLHGAGTLIVTCCCAIQSGVPEPLLGETPAKLGRFRVMAV